MKNLSSINLITGVMQFTRAIAIKQPVYSLHLNRKIKERKAPKITVNKTPNFNFAPLAGSAARIKAAAIVPPVNILKSISPLKNCSESPNKRVRKPKTARKTNGIQLRLIPNAVIITVPINRAKSPLSIIIPGLLEKSRSI
jgi:hypothetical protein